MADPDGNAYGPFDVEVPGSYSEEFSEAAWYRWNKQSGVISGGGLTFDGLTAQLAAIDARVRGSWFSRAITWENTSPATTTSSPRRDLMVLRRTLTVGEGDAAIPGQTVPVVLRGTPAATPADPLPDLTSDELLWSWQVPGSGGTAVTGIKDLRRFFGPYGDLGAAGIVGNAETPGGSGGVLAAYTSAEIQLPGLGFVAHMKPGRAYELKANCRVWSATAAPSTAALNARIVVRGATPSATSPLAASNTAVLSDVGDLRVPLSVRRTVQVAVENDYFISFWGNRGAGTGHFTFGVLSNGRAGADLFDVGPALPSLPYIA